MNAQVPVITVAPEQKNGSIKETIVYSLLAAVSFAGLAVLGKKLIDTYVSNAAHAKSFEEGSPETIAKQIKMAFDNDGYFGTNVTALRSALISIKSKVELDKVYKAYQREYGKSMYKDMSDELQSSEYNEMLEIVQAKPDKTGQAVTADTSLAWAKRLKAAFDKTYGFIPGTDEAAIKAVFIELPTQRAFINVGKAYYQLYNENLLDALKSELEFWEFSDYMKIILAKPKA